MSKKLSCQRCQGTPVCLVSCSGKTLQLCPDCHSGWWKFRDAVVREALDKYLTSKLT